MSDIDITLTDNSALILSEFEAAVTRALERCGLKAEGYAKDLCPVDSGILRDSITHEVGYDGDNSVAVGTVKKYAVYVEMGTGAYVSGGRNGWWVYVPGSGSSGKSNGKTYSYEQARRIMMMLRSKGLDAHMTCGQPPKPFIKPAVADHAQTYNNIIKDELGG